MMESVMAGVSDLLTGAMKSLGDGLHEKMSKVSALCYDQDLHLSLGTIFISRLTGRWKPSKQLNTLPTHLSRGKQKQRMYSLTLTYAHILCFQYHWCNG